VDEIRDELRVKEVLFDEGPMSRVTILPNLRVLGPRLGSQVNEVRAALQAGAFEELPDGGVRVANVDLGPEDIIRGERVAIEGWAIADEGPVSLALDVALDDELRLEGRALDTIRALNDLRKREGLELTDRIHVVLPQRDRDLLPHEGRIKEEVLGVSLEFGPESEPRITKA
jgi:isoleucyl-tRNA synthetase